MSDNAQLAKTGTAGALVIGGVAVTGFWLLALALAIVLVGAALIRVAFRPGLAASDSSSAATDNTSGAVDQ